ncbi:MAG: DUF177 domain-containing protein [Betaproteobacteria bacterium]|nr:DUF177 domain-containing protein [Betaproteobacteria bacterium]
MMLDVEQLARQRKNAEGTVAPGSLPRISEYLAAPGGEIQYQISCRTEIDSTGRQIKRLRCIISGWFFLTDPLTLEAGRFDLDIDSTLRLVASEADLPPLEAESDDEDVIVAGRQLDLIERLEEEILLTLPVTAVAGLRSGDLPVPGASESSKEPSRKIPPGSDQRDSPFAKLATLKKH